LSINIKKSKYIVFKPRQRRQIIDFLMWRNNHKIDQAKELVFLGVILDEHISWKPHISYVARKISKSIGIIYQASFCLSKVSLYKLYYSLVYSYLQYCIIVWGSTYPMNLNRIILLQKRIRFMCLCQTNCFLEVSIICFCAQNKFSNMIHIILIYIIFNFVQQNLDSQFSVIYQAPKFFNSLSRNIRDASTVYCFQSKLKNYLFSL
jgi:hypothetical protein